ncbi:MAG: PAS domain S-box protein [Planctomycetota bacterium]
MPAPIRSPKPSTAAVPAGKGTRNGAMTPRMLDPIITMDAGGIIQSASDSVEQIFGWTSTELLGRNLKMLIPEPRRSALDRYLDRYRTADKAAALQRTRRFDALRKDGTGIQIELSISRADLPAQSAPFFIGIIRDVSRKIDVGPDSEDEHGRLHRLIAEQTRALATANLRLQLADRLASLGTLTAGLGHDMNNVLLPIRARLNALEHAGLSAPALAHLMAVRKSVTYLQHLSDGLHFLALDPQAQSPASDGDGATDVAQWWSQVGALLRKAVPRHVKVLASLPAGLPALRIAPHWLTQAILNLIINAGEAIPEGRKNASVRLRACKVDRGSMVKLSVSDSGRGMSPVIQRRAFDLFFTTKSRSMGTGLGLPLARKIAVRAGGNLELKSEPGRGTTAMLILPTTRSAARPGRSGASTQSAAVSVRDHRIATLISQVLIGAGVGVLPASAGGPGKADLWITEPNQKALAEASRWHKGRAGGKGRMVVLLGPPPKAARPRWSAIGATVIDPPDDFGAIRHILGQAIVGGNNGHRNGIKEAGT